MDDAQAQLLIGAGATLLFWNIIKDNLILYLIALVIIGILINKK